MTRTEIRYSRAERIRRRRKKRMRRFRTALIFIVAVTAMLGGIHLAKITRGNGVGTGGVPLFLQTDPRWKDVQYGNSTIEISGCGPACLAMVTSALTGNQDTTPVTVSKFAEENGYYVDGIGTSWSLMSDGAKKLGLRVREIPLDESTVADRLTDGYPIICSVTRGDFTNEGHFIVLTAYENGVIRVNDPNSEINSTKLWTYDRLKGQISAMWSYKY